tara:strand:+ start:79 stop:1773 length:1695 start_codon:yes stop_codon:yes gene_type:complete
MKFYRGTLAAWLVQLCIVFSAQAQQVPDQIYTNGKIITVDDYFSIQQAVAVKGERIIAVGNNDAITSLADAQTQRIDLAGKTMIPGLIDNHNHVVRATEYWPNDPRLDGVTTRSKALKILRNKSKTLPKGAWLMSLGGWQESQFIDSQADFTLAELDSIATDRPVILQSVYDHIYGNSAWFKAMGIPMSSSSTPIGKAQGLSQYVVWDDNGNATGRLNGGFPMISEAIKQFPSVPSDEQEDAIKLAFKYYNELGLTSVYDPGGVGIKQESYARTKQLADSEGITLRVFHTLNAGVPNSPEAADLLIKRIHSTKPFQGSAAFDLIAMGEIYYGPFHWDDELDAKSPSTFELSIGRKILEAAASQAWPVQTHAMQPETIDVLFDVMTDINKEFPLRQLRWSITHADNIGASQIQRARQLGVNLQMRSISVLGDRHQITEKFGDASLDMPPLRLIQDSGIPFGLGTDGTKANQISPFVTLWWAITGQALNGDLVMRQTLSREEALIAHTRSNAYLMFQEANLGSIRPGFMADMLVLDQDYLTIPEDQIKSIRPVATILGGRLVSGEL